MRGQRRGAAGSGGYRGRRGGEGHEEGIALGIDLRAVVGGKRGAQQRLVVSQRASVVRSQLLEQARTAGDVGEEEGDGAGGESGAGRLSGFGRASRRHWDSGDDGDGGRTWRTQPGGGTASGGKEGAPVVAH